ncbi:epoxyqueuosine reductase QueH [Hominenteromicrobium sp.]|uniref:epoxyqueuosine reductase QueH n=1 Tax=Hominenteromicrobium sp. TaxID=3073581 RepID=UPI003AB676F8
MKTNYQTMLDKELNIIRELEIIPRLLLHSCCAPCSSYVLEFLSAYFDITLFYFNPNISPKEEFEYRISELRRLTDEMSLCRKPDIIVGRYEPQQFLKIAEGLENEPEGGARCFNCYQLRLLESATIAAAEKFDYFTTTLSISPYKNTEWLNKIGKELSEKYGVRYLFSDFKKKGGYLRSIELSKKYNLYRQNYCGCIYSKRGKVSEEENAI